jgi:hypothetical protein
VVGVALSLPSVFWWCLFGGPEVVLLVPRPVSCDAGLLGYVVLQFWIYWVCVAIWYRWLLLAAGGASPFWMFVVGILLCG